MEGTDNETLRIADLPEALRSYAEIIGPDNLMKLVRIKGGETFYIPKESKIERPELAKLIQEGRMNGKKIRELEEEYGLSRSSIYRYLHLSE